VTDYEPTAVLFSGETAFDALFDSAATVSLSALTLLIVFKGLAWSISLSSFRGGPTSRPSFSAWSQASSRRNSPATRRRRDRSARRRDLRLRPAPTSCFRHDRDLLSAKAGLEVAPLVVIAVVVAYLTSEALSAYGDARIGKTPEPATATSQRAAT
jgi:hypothetical protein